MINSDELYWEIFNYIKERRTLIQDGNTSLEADELIDSSLDSKIKNISISETSKAEELFDLTIDRSAFNSIDYLRLKNFLIDWYSAHKTIGTQQKDITDVFSLTEENIEELIRSFGFNYLPNYLTLEEKQSLFLDLVNLYKIKGSPESISKLLNYFGIHTRIHEYYLEKHANEDKLKFIGYEVDASDRRSGIEYNYETIVEKDPHWFHRDPETILQLLRDNKISLPTKTRYFSINPGSYIEKLKPILMLISTKIYVDFKYWTDTGNLPDEEDDRLIELTQYSTSNTLTFLELYFAFIYLFNKIYGPFNPNPNGLGLCYNPDGYYNDSTAVIIEDSTAYTLPLTPALPLINEYDGYKDIYDLFLEITDVDLGPPATEDHPEYTGITRRIKKILHDVFLNYFSRSASEMDYFSRLCDSTSNLLEEINPDLKAWLDVQDDNIIEYISTEVNSFIQAFIVFDLELSIVDIDFQNIFYYIFGFNNSISENILKSINFFKPYRSKLIDLKEIISTDKLNNSIRLEDFLDNINIVSTFIEFPQGGGNPCCDSNTLICYDMTAYPDDFATYPSRLTYDCGGYFDRGIVWDDLHLQLTDTYEDTLFALDSTAEIANYTIKEDVEFTGDNFIDTESGSPIDNASSLDYAYNLNTNTNIILNQYSLQQSGFPRTFDDGNEFDYSTCGFDVVEIYVQEIRIRALINNYSSTSIPTLLRAMDINVLNNSIINNSNLKTAKKLMEIYINNGSITNNINLLVGKSSETILIENNSLNNIPTLLIDHTQKIINISNNTIINSFGLLLSRPEITIDIENNSLTAIINIVHARLNVNIDNDSFSSGELTKATKLMNVNIGNESNTPISKLCKTLHVYIKNNTTASLPILLLKTLDVNIENNFNIEFPLMKATKLMNVNIGNESNTPISKLSKTMHSNIGNESNTPISKLSKTFHVDIINRVTLSIPTTRLMSTFDVNIENKISSISKISKTFHVDIENKISTSNPTLTI